MLSITIVVLKPIKKPRKMPKNKIKQKKMKINKNLQKRNKI